MKYPCTQIVKISEECLAQSLFIFFFSKLLANSGDTQGRSFELGSAVIFTFPYPLKIPSTPQTVAVALSSRKGRPMERLGLHSINITHLLAAKEPPSLSSQVSDNTDQKFPQSFATYGTSCSHRLSRRQHCQLVPPGVEFSGIGNMADGWLI